MLIGIMIACLLQHYTSLHKQVVAIQSLTHDHAELTWIGDLLRNNIKQAGFTPCGNVRNLVSLDRRTEMPLVGVSITYWLKWITWLWNSCV